MARRVVDTLEWLPRLLAGSLAAFLALYTVNAFAGHESAWHVLLSFLYHLIPAGVVVAMLEIALHWERLGGALFIIAGWLFVVIYWLDWVMVAPMLITGMLFFLLGQARRVR
jgi:hypothetical protein